MSPLAIPLTLALAASEEPAAVLDSANLSLTHMVMASGLCGWLVALACVASLLLALLRILELRMGRLAPAGLQRSLEQLIHGGDATRASDAASGSDSFLGRVAAAGLRLHGLGLDEMLANIERVATKESMRIGNRVATLARLGAATMLIGFLGTMLGLLLALRVSITVLRMSAEYPAPRPVGRMLESFWIALFPTTLGLLVALFCFAAFFVLDHRLTVRSLRVREMAEEMAYLVDAGQRREAATGP